MASARLAGAACAAGGGREAAAGGVRRAEDGAAVPRGEGGQRRAARAGLPRPAADVLGTLARELNERRIIAWASWPANYRATVV